MRPALILSTALLVACGQAAAPSAAPAPRVIPAAVAADLAANEAEVSMEILELMCSPCAAQIVREAKLLPGVTGVHLELTTKTLTLRYDTAATGRERVVAAVEQIVAAIQ
ncbi:MAG TPA: cation transporter [Candidatus Limnocylindria bacterium]|nr:cation transporter [Candidatus Limnocylindria bacterium]